MVSLPRLRAVAGIFFIMAVGTKGPAMAAGSVTAAASTGTSTIAAIALDYSQMQYLLTTETASAHFRYIVVQDHWHENVPALRAKYPDSKILVYKNVAATNSDCSADPYQSSGISYCYADATHPEWFLHSTAAGHPRLTFCDYSYLSAMDIGNVDYQRRWAGAVIHAMRRSGFDGVMMDDTNLYPGHCMDGQILEYSDAEYRQATLAFIHAVGPAIMSAGYIAMPNVGLATWDPAQTDAARDVALHVSVYNREFFVRWEEGSALFTRTTWSNDLALMDEIVGAGTPFNTVVYGSATDVAAQRYARATFLLGWDGQDGSALMYRPSADGIPYPAPWAADIGLPMAARYAVGAGWRREFDGGTVVVDPSATTSQTFALGGAYSDGRGRCVTSVTLAPATGLVMPRCP